MVVRSEFYEDALGASGGGCREDGLGLGGRGIGGYVDIVRYDRVVGGIVDPGGGGSRECAGEGVALEG